MVIFTKLPQLTKIVYRSYTTMASKSRVIQVKTMAEFHTHVDETKEAEDTNAKGVVVDFFATWCGYVSITWHRGHVYISTRN